MYVCMCEHSWDIWCLNMGHITHITHITHHNKGMIPDDEPGVCVCVLKGGVFLCKGERVGVNDKDEDDENDTHHNKHNTDTQAHTNTQQ